ncbi:hypothetical protein [Piscinibacter sakaiensis]|uniref:hypothetical protein n=1 Tax=Piscinibacter sakaiensis TaxID=1547922 RepID=UPI003AB0CFF1
MHSFWIARDYESLLSPRESVDEAIVGWTARARGLVAELERRQLFDATPRGQPASGKRL